LHGIELDFSSDYNDISENNITANNGDGVGFDHSSNNILSRNDITANGEHGIRISGTSEYDSMHGNNVTNNLCGILVEHSPNNRVFHNNLVENQRHAVVQESYDNLWDDGYPSGGNYWSNYTGVDVNNDGIGEIPYPIDADNSDRYPLVGSFNTFDAGMWNDLQCFIDIISNSTVSKFQLNKTEKTISFNVTDPDYMLCFCRVTLPNIIIQDMWQGNYTVFVNGETWLFKNWAHTGNIYIYFTYQDSKHQVTIIPEFPLAIILPLFMVLTMITVSLNKRKRLIKNQVRSVDGKCGQK
jgi:parallel beta-helix repeat protein